MSKKVQKMVNLATRFDEETYNKVLAIKEYQIEKKRELGIKRNFKVNTTSIMKDAIEALYSQIKGDNECRVSSAIDAENKLLKGENKRLMRALERIENIVLSNKGDK